MLLSHTPYCTSCSSISNSRFLLVVIAQQGMLSLLLKCTIVLVYLLLSHTYLLAYPTPYLVHSMIDIYVKSPSMKLRNKIQCHKLTVYSCFCPGPEVTNNNTYSLPYMRQLTTHIIRGISYTGAGVVSAEKQSLPFPSLRAHCSRFSNCFMKNRQSTYKYTVTVHFKTDL
jgi:hypothetical protein